MGVSWRPSESVLCILLTPPTQACWRELMDFPWGICLDISWLFLLKAQWKGRATSFMDTQWLVKDEGITEVDGKGGSWSLSCLVYLPSPLTRNYMIFLLSRDIAVPALKWWEPQNHASRRDQSRRIGLQASSPNLPGPTDWAGPSLNTQPPGPS